MSARDHYRVLRVPKSVDTHELKRAYRRMQRWSHPDTGGSAEHFQQVQEAWHVLGHPQRRADYDRHRPGGTHSTDPEPRANPTAQEPPYRRSPPTARERPRVRRADSHGHPGGSARLQYLDQFRAWLVDPTPPVPPKPALRLRGTGRMFLRTGLKLSVQMTAGFAAGAVALILVVAWGQGMLLGHLDEMWIPLAWVAGLGGAAGALCSVPIGLMRMLLDPYYRQRTRVRRETARRDRAAQEEHRSAVQAFEVTMRHRPANAHELQATPFSGEAVRMVPATVRRWLEKAISEEGTARALAPLGPEFSIWHDLHVGAAKTRIDHLVVGPQGLILIASLTAPGPVTIEFDALVHSGRKATEVVADLLPRLSAVAKALEIGGVSAAVLVYPDALLVDARPRRIGGCSVPTFVVGASVLAGELESGLPGIDAGAAWQVARVRARVDERVAFAE